MKQVVDGVERITGVRVTMRDGCALVADIYSPVHRPRPLPVLLLRLPYDRRLGMEATYAPPSWYARQGFIVVVQDTRGRYASDGEFVPFVHEAIDGYDTVEWAAALEGSNGRVGMYGASYSGYLQLLTATTQPPALRAICPAIAGSDLYRGWLYEGGALSHSFATWWAASLGLNVAQRGGHVEIETRLRAALGDIWRWYGSRAPYDLDPIGEALPFFRQWLDHPQRDDYWLQRSVEALYQRIVVPALHIGGWYDSFNEGTVRNFVSLHQQNAALAPGRNHQHMLIGPWLHTPWGRIVGSVDFGPEAVGSRADHAQVEFLRYHLDPTDAGSEPRSASAVRYFVLFENAWRTADVWPPREAVTQTWYLHSAGRANSVGGDGWLDQQSPHEDEASDSYAYTPSDPVPSIGGHSCCFEENAPMGPHDQAKLEQRNDILVYSSAALEHDLVLAGPTRLTLWVATDAPDADYTGKLCVVEGRGAGERVWNIAQGIYRATTELSAGGSDAERVVRLEIALRNVAARLQAGQRLRLEVTSGSFPMYDINPQSGVPAAQADPHDYRPAIHHVFHKQETPSHLVITVLSAPQ